MSWKPAVNLVGETLHKNDIIYIISNDEITEIEEFLSVMVKTFERLEEDEEVVASADDIHAVMMAVQVCKRVAIEEPISDRVRSLLEGIIKLAFNWNQNMQASSQLEVEIKFVDMFLQQHYTVVASIDVLKALLRLVKTYSSVPRDAGLISAHYLKALDALHEGESSEEDSCI